MIANTIRTTVDYEFAANAAVNQIRRMYNDARERCGLPPVAFPGLKTSQRKTES